MSPPSSPPTSHFGPSRSGSVRRQVGKPYDRPSSSSVPPNLPRSTSQNGLFGGLKRRLSTWFTNGNQDSEAETERAESRERHTGQDENVEQKVRAGSQVQKKTEFSKRQAPQMSPERGTPSKKQRVVSPSRLEVQGRAVEAINVREYDGSRLATRYGTGTVNYARPMGAEKAGGMSRSQTIGGGYNDPPLGLLAGSPARSSKLSLNGLKRSDTMKLNLEAPGSRAGPVMPYGSPYKSPIYSSSASNLGVSRSTTLGSLASPSMVAPGSPVTRSPYKGQEEAAERAARSRALREGSVVRGGSVTPMGSPVRRLTRAGTRMEVESHHGTPGPALHSPLRAMSTVPFPRSNASVPREPSVAMRSPSRQLGQSRLRQSVRPMETEQDDEEEYLVDEEQMELDTPTEAKGRRGRSAIRGGSRTSVDTERREQSVFLTPAVVEQPAEALLNRLADMRRKSRHPNIQAGLPSSVQPTPIPESLSTRQARKRGGIRVPKASPAAELLGLRDSTVALPLSARLGLDEKQPEVEKAKTSIMSKPYGNRPVNKGKGKEHDHAEQEKEDDQIHDDTNASDAGSDRPFVFSMSNAPTKVSAPLNIQFSPSATKIVRTGPSTMKAQSAVTSRKHEPAAQRSSNARSNKFGIPEDDDMEDEELDEPEERQATLSPQPVAIPPPMPNPSQKKRKDVDVTAVRKARGFLDAAGINRPRASSPLAAAPLTAPPSKRASPPKNLALQPSSAPKSAPVQAPDFFAMPKKAPAAPVSPAPAKTLPGIGLGKPAAPSTPTSNPTFSFTAPSPSTSVVKDATPAFSFGANASATITKPAPFAFNAPSVPTAGIASATPAIAPSPAVQLPAEKPSESAKPAPPSFFGNVTAPNAPASTTTFSFSTADKPPLSLFGSAKEVSASAVTKPQEQPAASAPAPVPATSSPFKFQFGSSAPASSGETAFAKPVSAIASSNPLLASSAPDTAAKTSPAPSGFTFGTTSTTPVSTFTFGKPDAASAATSIPAPPAASTSTFSFGNTNNDASKPATSNGSLGLFGATPSAGTSLFDAVQPASGTASVTPAFSFGSTSNTAAPASAPSFTFGTAPKVESTPAPFNFGTGAGVAKPADSPFGAASTAATPTSSTPFGQAPAAASSPFGTTPSANVGSTPAFTFGQPNASQPPSNPFGAAASAVPAATTGFGGFGATAPASNVPTPPGSGGMFGATSSGFGAPASTQPSMFGAPVPTTPGTGAGGFSFNMGAAGSGFPSNPDASRQPSPAFSVGAGDSPGGRKIRKLPGARKK